MADSFTRASRKPLWFSWLARGSAVFIFKAASTLITAAASSVNLATGAHA